MKALGRRGLVALAALAAALAPLRAIKRQDRAAELIEKLSYPRTIVVVRHAEKAAEPANDPALSKEGAERAQRLAKMLAKAGVSHLFASEYQRTQATLLPLSLACGAKVEVAPAREPKALASAVDSLPRGSVAVVAAHSNTVGPIVGLLSGGEAKVALDESEYGRMFVVTQWGPEKQASVLELHY
jgi:phosphohistidine phosphatase SixA